MAGVHDFMKSAALQPFDVLKQEIVSNKVGGRRSSLRRMSLRTYSTTGFIALRQLDVENLLTKSNNTITSKRFYAQSAEGSEYNAVGWILHEGVTNCMFCGTYFGTMQKKHNCSACGLVSCGNCASNYVFIAELNDQRKHRVCNNCHGDSDTVSAVEKFSRAPRGRVSEHYVAGAAASPTSDRDETSSILTDNISPDGPGMHLAFMKSVTSKPLQEVKIDYQRSQGGHAISRRKSFLQKNIQGVYLISNLVEEPFMTRDSPEPITLHRVYVTSTNGGGYCDVGWIIKDEASHCMDCGKGFGTMSTKYHCKACGDIFCGSCCKNSAKIAELGPAMPAQRICNRCHTGLEVVHIRSTKPFRSDAPQEAAGDDKIAEDEEKEEIIPSLEQTPSSTPFCYCFGY